MAQDVGKVQEYCGVVPTLFTCFILALWTGDKDNFIPTFRVVSFFRRGYNEGCVCEINRNQ